MLGSALAVSDPMPDGETVLVNNSEAIGKTPVPASALLLLSGLLGSASCAGAKPSEEALTSGAGLA